MNIDRAIDLVGKNTPNPSRSRTTFFVRKQFTVLDKKYREVYEG